MRSSLVVVAVVAVAALGCHRDAPRVAWHRPIEIAVGGGTKGPWQQNNSRFDYVDDPSAVIDAHGAVRF